MRRQHSGVPAGISRDTLYNTYADLRREFDERRTAEHADPQANQDVARRVQRLSDTVTRLKRLLADHDRTIAELTAFQQPAISRVAARHEEITWLRVSPSAPDAGGARLLRRIDSPR